MFLSCSIIIMRFHILIIVKKMADFKKHMDYESSKFIILKEVNLE